MRIGDYLDELSRRAVDVAGRDSESEFSTLYTYDNSLVAGISGDHRGTPLEVSEHTKDGSKD